MKRLTLAMLFLFGAVGCNDAKHSGDNGTNSSTTDRDNTGVNVRDRDPGVKTPFDQKENKPDIAMTAEIRKRVVATEMSTDAKNVKIITENGHVTLRGPVKSADEKTAVEKIAEQVAGPGSVDNQLEVASGR